MNTFRWLSVTRLAGVILAVFLGFAAFLPGWAAEERLDLVRIELEAVDDLSLLRGTGTIAYARLYKEDGGLALLLGADARMQERLEELGYQPVILKRDIEGVEFYMLYGLPADLGRVGQRMVLLAREGRQAVVDLDPAQLRLLDSLGVAYMPLYPQPLRYRESPTLQIRPVPAALQPDPLVQEMIDQVSSAALANYVGELSGEWAVNIEGMPFTLSTRNSFVEPAITKATRYAYERFVQMGLPADYHAYSLWGVAKRNVQARQTGVTQPEREFLLTAHLDSTSPSADTLAPGADDNASGTAGVLATARILEEYEFGCSLRYVLFTGEEQGMVGSAAYAQEVANTPGLQVEGVLNLDMIAYNSPASDPTLELHVRTGNAGDLQIAGFFQQVVSTYSLDLTPVIIQPGSNSSDHASFWNQSIPAVLAIEDWSDHTPSYHTTADRLSTLNMPYFTEFTRAAVGTLAHLGCLLDDGVLRGKVTDASSSAALSGASVKAVLDGSHSWTTTTQVDGSYQLVVPPGDYTVEIAAPFFLPAQFPGTTAVRAKETSLNADLQPCSVPVGFSSQPILPNAGEMVTFTASAGGLPPGDYAWEFGDGESGNGQVVSHTFASAGLFTVSLEIQSQCPGTIVEHAIPVGIPALFFPFVPVSAH